MVCMFINKILFSLFLLYYLHHFSHYRCLGTNFRCNFAMFGCSYKGARNEHKEHVKTCKYQRFKGIVLLIFAIKKL